MIGQTISHYKILEKLGEGGMGVVYKAEDINLHRTVALKVLPRGKPASKEDSTRLAREAQAAASLHHPNIATIFEFNEIEDPTSHTTNAFIAMEYVEGETLGELIQKGRISIEQARAILIQIAHGLQTAHSHGVVHRDIKPSNIIIMRDGTAKLLDFGVARLGGETTISTTGSIVGSFAYMSPEQAKGEKVDARSDIWSLGVILFEMLSGRIPFRGEHSAALMYSITNEPHLDLLSLRRDAPDDLVALCNGCLVKEKEKRPQSVGDVLHLLGEDPSVKPYSPFARFGLHSRRITPVAGAFVILAAILVWYILAHIQGQGPSRLTLAIMRFRDETKDSLVAGWPAKVQLYLSTQLTGARDIAVTYHDYSDDLVRSAFGASESPSDSKLTTLFSNDVKYLLTGSIYKQAEKFAIRAVLLETNKGFQLQSFEANVVGEDELGTKAGYLSEQILAYLYTQVLQSGDKDLAIWKERPPKNWKAVDEFSQANEFILNGQDKEAVQRLGRSVELDSNFLSPRIWMIPGLRAQKKTDDVKRHYEFLLRMQPSANTFESAMIDWVGAYLTNNYALQVHFLRIALLSSRDNRILLVNLADSEAKLGNYADALDALQPCLRTRWRYTPTYRIAGECLLKTGDVEAAKKLLNDATSNDQVDLRIYPMLAAVYKKEGDGPKAARHELSALKAYKEKNRPIGAAYEHMAGYLTDIGRLDSAKAAILRALDEDANVASYHGQFAEILFKQGDLTESQRESDVALKVDSSYSKGHFLLGEIFEKKGDRSGAIENYTQFIRSDSTSYVAQITRQRLKILQR
jgi:serine/threonine protein kinase/Tfp pilus assembly protein PilF